jgi:hypothetical protein
MIKEFDTVVLLQDVKEHGLQRGDIGAVVYDYENTNAVEVEFVTGEGETVGILPLSKNEVLRMEGREVLHVRPLAV